MITDFWSVEDGELVLYKRAGSCNKCGACCDKAGITFHMKVRFCSKEKHEEGDPGTETVSWEDYEGWSIFKAQGIWWYFKLQTAPEDVETEGACGDFVDGLCASWDTEQWRPICRYWPFHPRDLERFPTCGYTFEKVKEVKDEQ